MDGGFQRSPGRTETSRIRVKTMNEDALAQIRKRAGNTRVVLLSGIGMDVPYCAGTADPEGETRLKDLQEQLVWQNSWCCSDFDKEKGTHPFQHPREYVKMQTC